MKTKYLKYTLIFIIILLIAIYAINEGNSPKNKMKTFLETQDYESITFYKVIDSGPSNTPDDINISFTVDSTDDLIKNVFSVKAELERYLKDNENSFKNSNVRVSFYDDSIPLSITISNQGDDDYKSDNYYELDYGFFACRDLDISEFNNAPQFDVLLLNHFKDYNDVSALDSMDSLEKLIMYNENDDVVTDIDYLIEKHPDCTIICNGETVYEPTKVAE